MTTHSKNYASAANAKRAAESYYKGLGVGNPAEGEHYGFDPAGAGTGQRRRDGCVSKRP